MLCFALQFNFVEVNLKFIGGTLFLKRLKLFCIFNWLMYIWFIDGFLKEVELVFGKHFDITYISEFKFLMYYFCNRIIYQETDGLVSTSTRLHNDVANVI